MLEIRKLVDEIQKNGEFTKIVETVFKITLQKLYIIYIMCFVTIDLSGSSQSQKEIQCKITEDRPQVKRQVKTTHAF